MSVLITSAARSSARTSLSEPPRFPIGVRTPSIMNASVTVIWNPSECSWSAVQVLDLRSKHCTAERRDDGAVLIRDPDGVKCESVRRAGLHGDGGEHISN